MPAQEPPPPAATATTGDGTDNGTESTAPLNQAIRIFARIRPRKANANIRDTSTSGGATKVVVDGPIPGDDNAPQLHFHVPRDETLGLINNSREHFGFRFDRVFDDRTTQEEVFDHVAKDIILSVLDGFNATVFAYGQTGSGKTFTITGGAERYADRGLIPRTVQFIFKEVAQRTKRRYSIGISYLEIYNENGYDLLDDTRDAKRLEDLPKVTLRESEDQTIQLQNLGCHPAASEEEALNWLFTGDTNKMIAETPSNPASSRSHCLFIISIESREEGSEVIRRSKLHLVDLAGSERVSKTGIDGMLLKEAKSINLSLHFLEHVIVALHEKAMGRRTHVPYRNSMMTSILRDSLGGNCKTCMVATLATEEHLLEESISTCRFAQRVALISNRVSVNEELDPYLVIARLKQQIAQLKAELALARGDEDGASHGDELAEYELARVVELVQDYLNGDDSAVMFTDYRKAVAAFGELRRMMRSGGGGSSHPIPPAHARVSAATPIGAPSSSTTATSDEITQLQRLLTQRDTEIGVLIPMVNQYKARVRALEGAAATSANGAPVPLSQRKSGAAVPNLADSAYSSTASLDAAQMHSRASIKREAGGPLSPARRPENESTASLLPAVPTARAPAAPIGDRTELIEAFKASYVPLASIEAQKAALKECYARAKTLGAEAQAMRERIKRAKDKLSCLRANFDGSGLADSSASSCLDLIEAEEAKLRSSIGQDTAVYKVKFQELKDLKLETEHLQHLLERAKMQFNKDFHVWLTDTHALDLSSSSAASPDRSAVTPQPFQRSLHHDSGHGPSARGTAWGTPRASPAPDPRSLAPDPRRPPSSMADDDTSLGGSRPSSRLDGSEGGPSSSTRITRGRTTGRSSQSRATIAEDIAAFYSAAKGIGPSP